MKYLLITFLTTFLFSIADFGVRGKVYEIKETNFLTLIKKRINDLNVTELKKKTLIEYNKMYQVKLNTTTCSKKTVRNKKLFYTLEYDMVDPLYKKVIYKKGYKYNFLRFESKYQRRKILFAKLDELKYLNLHKLQPHVIFITDGNLKNIKKYKKKYIINKADMKTLKTFNLRCTPTLYTPSRLKYKIEELGVIK